MTFILASAAATSVSDFEYKLSTGLSSEFCREMTAAAFPTPADRGYLKSLTKDLAPATNLKVREVHAIPRGFSITAPNGRGFTLTRDPASRDFVLVNGQRLAWRGRTLERFTADVSAALHRTYVTRHLPWLLLRSDRAEALIPGIVLFVGLASYFVFQDCATWPARRTANS